MSDDVEMKDVEQTAPEGVSSEQPAESAPATTSEQAPASESADPAQPGETAQTTEQADQADVPAGQTDQAKDENSSSTTQDPPAAQSATEQTAEVTTSEANKTDERTSQEGLLDGPELEDVDKEIAPEAKEEKQGDDENDDVPAAPPGPVPPRPTRKERSLKDFLNSMDDYAPIIPEAVTDYYLARAGFETSDGRIKKLLALATQKFVSDIAADAYQYSRIRSSSSLSSSSNPHARARALAAGAPLQPGSSAAASQGKIVLTTEDLSNALVEYGLNVRRPDFYR